MAIRDTLDSLLAKVKDIARTSTVFGDPIIIGDIRIIPVSKVSVGFGSGAMQNSRPQDRTRDSEGMTGGFSIVPVALLVVQDNESKLLLLDKQEQNLSKMMDLVPDILDRFVPKKNTERGADS